VATVRGDVQQAIETTFSFSIDEVLGSLVGRASLYRLVDDIATYLASSPALYHLADDLVEYLVTHPAVRDLVHAQGANLTDEIIDQSREHLVRADAVVDRTISAVRTRLHVRKRRARPSERPR
jgi:hypothetical protein